jgi:hypothetical protein
LRRLGLLLDEPGCSSAQKQEAARVAITPAFFAGDRELVLGIELVTRCFR